jgi:hypothetical protein
MSDVIFYGVDYELTKMTRRNNQPRKINNEKAAGFFTLRLPNFRT